MLCKYTLHHAEMPLLYTVITYVARREYKECWLVANFELAKFEIVLTP